MSTRVRVAMPGDLSARPRGWLVAAGPVVLLALGALVILPLDAREPSGYIKFHMHDRAWTYPLHEVLVAVSIVIGELLLAIAWLAARTSKTSLGGRAFLISALMMALFVSAAPWTMHADNVVAGLLAWQFFAAAWLFVVALGHGIVALASLRS